MLAVSNTSPLRYLITTGCVDILPHLYIEVLVPPGVVRELSNDSAPTPVRDWIGRPPMWLQTCQLKRDPDSELVAALDLGEREAIQLATERNVDVLIMDELKGRAMAQRRGLPLVGAVGVLGEAYRKRVIDNPLDILDRMRQHGFRIGDRFVAEFRDLLLTRYRRRS